MSARERLYKVGEFARLTGRSLEAVEGMVWRNEVFWVPGPIWRYDNARGKMVRAPMIPEGEIANHRIADERQIGAPDPVAANNELRRHLAAKRNENVEAEAKGADALRELELDRQGTAIAKEKLDLMRNK